MIQQSVQNGFTLIEMLVALLLLSMISIIGYQGVIFTLNQWGKGEQKLAASQYKYQSNVVIRKMLSRIERSSYEKNGQYINSFAGKHHSLRFVSKFENIRQGGLYICELFANNDKKILELAYSLMHPENGQFDNPRHKNMTEVLKGIEKVRFWYFGSQNGEKSRWYDKWESETRFPKLVKYQLIDISGSVSESIVYIETADI